MGGINHQPCRTYSDESTRLSRGISLAYLELEQANVALEDAILAELAGQRGSAEKMLEHLALSACAIEQSVSNAEALRQKMQTCQFVDLPTLGTIDLDVLSRKLVAKGIVDQAAFVRIVDLQRSGGFRSVLGVIDTEIKELLGLTRDLEGAVELLKARSQGSNLHAVLEENQEGNIKVSFARLYSAWAKFNQFFLASAMFSTELWYVYMGYGSLTGEAPVTKPVPELMSLQSRVPRRAIELAPMPH